MKTGRFEQSDSTGLMLDIVCNVFGGILLIAILVALLAQETESELTPDPNSDAKWELIQRRIGRIIAENERIKQKNAELEEEMAAMNDPIRYQLLDSLTEAKQELDTVEDELQAQQRALNVSSNINADDLLENLKTAKAEAENQLAAEKAKSLLLEASLGQLKQRELDLVEERKVAKEKQISRKRLPQERPINKKPLWVLVRYGKLYPVRLPSSRNIFDRNKGSIRWTDEFESKMAEPIPEKGIVVLENDTGWKAYLSRWAPGEYFLTFAVWPDSYRAFNAAKRIAVDEPGMSYGWDVWDRGEVIVFGDEGSVPKPQ